MSVGDPSERDEILKAQIIRVLKSFILEARSHPAPSGPRLALMIVRLQQTIDVLEGLPAIRPADDSLTLDELEVIVADGTGEHERKKP